MRSRVFIPPPPGEAHGETDCRVCCRRTTSHISCTCWSCGDWAELLPVDEITAGDLMLDHFGGVTDWAKVAATARYETTVVVIVVDVCGDIETQREVRFSPTTAVWVAAAQRPKIGMVAA